MYADDTVIYYHHKDLTIIEETLTIDLELLSNWMEKNELIFNLKKRKTEAMVFRTKCHLSKVNHGINITHRSEKMNLRNSYRYLGVLLDRSLNLSDHFNLVYKKSSNLLRLLKKIRIYLTPLAALRIYQSLIIFLIIYCSLTNYFYSSNRRRLLNTPERNAETNLSRYYTNRKFICLCIRKAAGCG